MPYKKLIIISTHELDRRISVLFQVTELTKRGACVEYWNISEITYREHVKPVNLGIWVKEIKTEKAFEEAVKKNNRDETLYIVYTNYCYKTCLCYRILSRYDSKMLYCINGVLPSVFETYKHITKDNIIRAIKNKCAALLLKTPLISPVRYELVTCANAGHAHKIGKATHTISYNSTDYEDSLHSGEPPVTSPYIVFLDQYLPCHPDNILAGEKGADVELYFSQMNHLFDVLERNYNCKVIIAAHPAANGYASKNPYNGRLLMTGITRELVKHSIGVVSHFSTAIYFAVIYNKPLLLVTSKDISENLKRVHTHSVAFAASLNCDFLMLDDIPEDFRFKHISKKSYDEFKYHYITNPDSEHTSNADVLMSIYNGEYE